MQMLAKTNQRRTDKKRAIKRATVAKIKGS